MSRRVSAFAFIAVLLLLALNASPSAPTNAAGTTQPTTVKSTPVPPSTAQPKGGGAKPVSTASGAATTQPTKPAGKQASAGATLQAAPQGAPGPAPDLVTSITALGGGGTGGKYQMGYNGSFTITVTNAGNADLPSGTVLNVSVVLPPGFQYKAQNSGGSGGGSSAVWTCSATDFPATGPASTDQPVTDICTTTLPAALGPAVATAFTFNVFLNKFAYPSQTLQVSVDPLNGVESNINNNGSQLAVPVLGAPDMHINKIANFSTFIFNNTQTYTIQITNNGKLDAAPGAVTVTDIIPAGPPKDYTLNIAIVGISGPDWNCSFNTTSASCTNTNTIPVLVPGGTASLITVSVKASASANPLAPNAGENSATVSATGEPPSLQNDNSITTAEIPAQGAPQLSIKKDLNNDTFLAGSNTGKYTLTVTNVGQGPTVDTVTITDPLPTSGGVSMTLDQFQSAAGFDCTSSLNTATATCTLTSAHIAASGTASVVLTVKVPANFPPGDVTNTATVQDNGDAQPNTGKTSSVTTHVKSINISVAKSHVGNFTVDASKATHGTYSITLTNNGTGTNALANSADITLVDTVPVGLEFATATSTDPNWQACTPAGAPNPDGTVPVTCVYHGALNPGTTTTLTFNVNVLPAAGLAGSVTNSVTITTTGNISTQTTATDTTTVQGFNLTIVKTFVPQPSMPAGTPGSFRIQVHNSGTTVATSGTTTVTDTVAADFVISGLAAANPAWDCGLTVGQAVSCNIAAAIAAGGDFPVLIIPVTPKLSSANTSVPNTATVTNNNDIDTTTQSNASTINVPIGSAPAAQFSVTKSHSDPCTVNADCVYTVTVTNTGQVAINSPIHVTDVVPGPDMTITSVDGLGAPANWTCPTTSGVQISCDSTANALPLGTSQSLTLSVHAKATTNLNSPYTNTVSATIGSVTQQFDDITHMQAAAIPDLAVTKSHPANMVAGQASSYTITVSDAGTENIPNGTAVTVIENVPSNMQLLSAGDVASTWSCTPTTAGAGVTHSTTVTCTTALTADLTPGSALPLITIGVKPVSPLSGAPVTVHNVVSINTISGDTNLTNNTFDDATIVSAQPAPDITLTKTHAGSFTAGQNAQYTITVTNKGSAASNTQLTVSDTLPAGLSIVSASGGGWNCVITTTPITCTNPAPNFDNTNPLQPITMVVKVATSAGGQISNTATINQPANDADPNNNSSTDTVTVQGVAFLTITKSHSSNFQVSANGTYTVTVTNTGSVATTGTITVNDTLPSVMHTVVSAGAVDGWTCTLPPVAGVLSCARTTPLSPGQQTHYDIVVTVDSNAPLGPYNNVVQVVNASNANPNTSFTDQTFVGSQATADLSMTLTPTTPSFTIGGSTNLTATIRSLGPASFSGNVQFNVTLPAGLTLISGTGGGFTCTPGSGTVTCGPVNLSLPATNTAVVTLNVGVTATQPASGLSITAAITPSVDGNAGNDSSTVIGSIVTSPPASAARSTINAAPASVPADGTTTTTIFVHVNDANGTGLSGKTVNVTGSPNNATFSNGGVASTDATGLATLTATSLTVGPVTFTATVPSDSVTIQNVPPGLTRTVQFQTPANTNINPAASTISANPTTLLINNYTTIIVHVVRNNGQVGAGVSVTLTATGGTAFATNGGTATTDGSGNATFSVVANSPAAITIGASMLDTNGTTVTLGHTVVVTWTSTVTSTPTVTGTVTTGGVADGGKSTFTTNYVSIPADNVTTATLTATLRNSSGGAVSGKSVSVSFNPVLTGMSLATSPTTTDSNGNATFTVRSVTQGGPVTFTATDTTDGVTISQTVQITFTAPGTQPVASTTAGATATAVPGGTGLLGAPNTGPSIGIVVPYILCVRSGPGTNYPALGRLQGGTQIVLVGKNPLGTARNFPPRTDCQRGRGGATWFMIQLDNNQVGWVSAFYIRVRRLQFRHLPVVDVPGTTTAAK